MSTVQTVPADLDQRLQVAEAAARSAALILVECQGRLSDLAVQLKTSETDPVTEADIAAEKKIREVISETFPDDSLIGEEAEQSPGTSGFEWVIDPLDGTVNFTYGLPQWCVSIACREVTGEGVVGVIFDPCHDELWSAVTGGRLTLNGKVWLPANERRSQHLATSLVATGFGYDQQVRVNQAKIASEVVAAARDLRRAGSAALDLAWVAAGRLDAYFEFGVKEWDIAAGEQLIAAAGLVSKRLGQSDGRGLPAGVVAGHPKVVDELLAIVG